jgi:hypothetical protein
MNKICLQNFTLACTAVGARGGAVVKALRYKPEGRGIDSRWSHYGPGVDSASNRNEYQGCFLGVKEVGAQG